MSRAQATVSRSPPLSWEATRWSLAQIGRGAWQMIRMPRAVARRPAHVPPERVVDFDCYRQPGLTADVHAVWKKLQDGPDIFWTPRNGGHWVVTRADDIDAILRDPANFSSVKLVVPRQSMSYRMLPIESDPPEHARYRHVVDAWFTPEAVGAMEGDIRRHAVELIEGFRHRGACEFVADFAQRLPIVVFLALVNLPLADRDRLLAWSTRASRAISPWQRMAAVFWMDAPFPAGRSTACSPC